MERPGEEEPEDGPKPAAQRPPPRAETNGSEALAALGRKAAAEGARLLAGASEHAATQLAAALKPARNLGRAVEGQRIVAEATAKAAVSDATYRVRRRAVSAGLHGLNLAGAVGRTTVALLADPNLLARTGTIFAEVRREIAEALTHYDRAASEAAQGDRERLALDAVVRLKWWDHATTRHHASAWLHVSVGPGRAEAWGMVLRGPHAGRSLAALPSQVLAELAAQAPDAETAAALEAWRRALSGAA